MSGAIWDSATTTIDRAFQLSFFIEIPDFDLRTVNLSALPIFISATMSAGMMIDPRFPTLSAKEIDKIEIEI